MFVRTKSVRAALTWFGKTVSVLAIFLIGLVSYLTVNPEAHEFFHHDSDHADHQCVVTAFAAGEGLCSAPPVDVQPVAVVVGRSDVVAVEILRQALASRLPPVCGPPVRSAVA